MADDTTRPDRLDLPLDVGGLDETIGLEILEATPDRVRARLPVTPAVLQPYGIVHGGAYCTIVETLASTGGHVWLRTTTSRGQVVGVNNNTNFLRAVREGVLSAEATPVHRGRLQQLWQVVVRDEQDRVVARGEVRLQNLSGERTV